MKNFVRTAVGVAISAVLIWWTLRGESPSEVWATIKDGNMWLLAAAVFVATFGFFIRALRWDVILRPVQERTSLDARFGAISIGFMANNLLPGRIGEVGRAYAFGRMETVSMSAAFGTLVVERLLDGLVLAAFFVIPTRLPGFPGAALLAEMGPLISGVVVIMLGLTAFLALLLAWPSGALRTWGLLLTPLPARWSERILSSLSAFIESLEILRRPGLLVSALAWSVAFWAWHGVSFYLGMLAFDIDAGFIAAIFTEATVGFGVAIPAAPGFFGTFHASAKWALTDVFGVEALSSLAFAYGYHLGGFFPITLIGLWYARRIGLSLGELGRGAPPEDDGK